MSPADRIDWQVENLRLTSFLPPDAAWDPNVDWWTPIAERDSERRSIRRSPPLIQDRGRIDDYLVRVQVMPKRVDLLLSNDPSGEESIEGYPTAGPVISVLPTFQRLARKWLSSAPSIQRLAFGAELLFPVADRKEGFRTLLRYLPNVNMNVDLSTDLVYQINKPRSARTPVEGLSINRLSTWSVVILQRVLVSATPGIIDEASLGTANACKVTLDINSSPESPNELPREHRLALLEELIDLGLEIAARGDIP